ncbi:MAG: hypothetical protein JOZ51_06785 [Chloroflexi bacterium]|nr:hypothetical protein [Chloroflexota bacterium]
MPYRHTAKTEAERRLAFFEALHKEDLHQLADRLLGDEPEAIELCVAFIEADTRGNWHGRARAMMARRLKHCTLSTQQQTRLITAILGRFVSGNFAEQFKDQIRLVLHLHAAQVFAVARNCLAHPLDYPQAHVRRYAAWILAHAQQKPAQD